ncbi:hypothetical protein Tco_0804383 [Tanacetum coccineum]|uniref:Uncharacterized protein n=1 Tax=Tanacetum coccineum TaxID=301880 RepID=A0ABQ5A519_9ASTR
MSSSVILIPSDSTNESVEETLVASPSGVLDFVVHSYPKSEPSKAPLLLDIPPPYYEATITQWRAIVLSHPSSPSSLSPFSIPTSSIQIAATPVVPSLLVQTTSTPSTVPDVYVYVSPTPVTETTPVPPYSEALLRWRSAPLSTCFPLPSSGSSLSSLDLSSSSSRASPSSSETSSASDTSVPSSKISSHSSYDTSYTSLGPIPLRRHQLSSYATNVSRDY